MDVPKLNGKMSNPSLQPADAMPGESPQLLYIDIDGSRYDILEEEIIPRQMENGVIVICLEGEAEVILDLKTYLIKRGDLCIIFPFTIIQVVRRSSNFKGYAMGLSVEFISNIQVKSDMAYYLYIKENPCISLSEEEQRMLLELCDMIAKKSLRQDYPFRQEIIDKLLMALE